MRKLVTSRRAEAMLMCHWYLTETVGAEAAKQFASDCAGFGRIGQALMANLSPDDYYRLSGSLFDPFYVDDKVMDALNLLTK